MQSLILVIGITLTVLSQSETAVVYTILLAGLLMVWPVLKWQPKPRAAAVFLGIVLATVAGYYISQHFTETLAIMDKDPHMTGRVDLWQLSIAEIEKRPLLGYGYEAFWGYDSQPARRIRQEVHWEDAPHAHNAYIDMTLSLGFVGLAAYLLVYLIVLKRALRYFMAGTESYRKWPLSYLTFVLLYQFTESGILGGNNVLWIIFVGLTFGLTLNDEESESVVSPQLSALEAAA